MLELMPARFAGTALGRSEGGIGSNRVEYYRELRQLVGQDLEEPKNLLKTCLQDKPHKSATH